MKKTGTKVKKASKKGNKKEVKKTDRKKEYSPFPMEKKWQKKWESSKIFKSKEESRKPKYYVLDMFPYPSGEGLHVGHPKGYIATDIFSRFKRMSGYSVLHPMGFDAFGLPAENYALKTKTNPADSVKKNVARYKKQLEILGFDYDWSREVNTTDPKFYKWTQWIFLQLLKKGLAYESYEPINWCPSCKTGLANEDVEDGKCERCGTVVEKKPMRQWVLSITKYADRLLDDLDAKGFDGKPLLDWPESIKILQRNWIGKSQGVNFKQKIKDLNIFFEVYDSIPQTFLAQTFTVIAPEHKLVKELVKGTEREKEVMQFVERIIENKRANRFDVEKDMEGIFTGRYVENPFGTGDFPIWIASYVLAEYGTGIVNCSAHDERDFAFAKKYNIPLKIALLPEDKDHAEKVKNLEVFYRQPDGIIQTPQECAGLKWTESREKIIDYIITNGYGRRTINYKLRDWVFSRQRYWGEPIPVIHCENCAKDDPAGRGIVPVPEKDLPVVLPRVKSYEPTGTGESPLASIDKWVNVKCPVCKSPAKRETNTMPQWAGSSWYYLRYLDPNNPKVLVDPKKEKYWSPVDLYVGGAEHATRHLIYARFWHKFLYDIGAVSNTEPFIKLQHVGLIMGEDGRKMSKRFGNVINPDEIVKTYGADSMRLYEMFMGPFDQQISWSTSSIVGVRRFIEKVWNLNHKVANSKDQAGIKSADKIIHKTIKKVSEDIVSLRFNTAISAMMIAVNELEKMDHISRRQYETILQLLAPFTPHFTEELWAGLGNKRSIHLSAWPEYDESLIADDEVTIMVQINGKVRGSFIAPADASNEMLEDLAKKIDEAKKWIEGKKIEKIIVVPKRLVNIVVS